MTIGAALILLTILIFIAIAVILIKKPKLAQFKLLLVFILFGILLLVSYLTLNILLLQGIK